MKPTHSLAKSLVLIVIMALATEVMAQKPGGVLSWPESLVPDLATSWSWSADNKTLMFKLHRGVKWHDGKPFTATDVKCTWDTNGSSRNLAKGQS